MSRAPYGAFLLALAAASCSDGSEATTSRPANASFDTLPGGRVLVTNTGEPVWTPEMAWELNEDLRLGTADAGGPTEQQFGLVFAVASDSRGRIYVLDIIAQVVRVFGPDGSFAHEVGRPGEGPGELAQPFDLSIGPGDTLWVADQGTGRYSLFAPDGTFVRALRRPTFLHAIRGHALPGGRYVEWGFTFPDGGFGRVDLMPIRVGPTVESADTFPAIQFTQRLMEGGRPAVFFSTDPTGTVDRDGTIWFAHRDEYEIHRRTLKGDTILTIRLPAEPHPLEAADREWVEERLSGRPSRLREAYLAALPELRPLIGAIVPDGAGHVYVLVDVAGRPAGTTLDVFEESGVYLGRLQLPSRVSRSRPVIHATRDYLYLVITDELDVQYASRLRVIKPPG